MDLSLIIVNYNTRELLRQCLLSLRSARAQLELEIFVIDNASRDHSAEMVKQEFAEVELMQNAANAGFAAANNQGLRRARGEYLLLLNSDTEVRPGALEHCLEFFRAHPEAGVVGCKLLNADGSIQPSCESFLSLPLLFYESFFLEKIFPHNRVFGRRAMTYFDYDRALPVDYVKGAFLMIRRRAFEDVGLLDEGFFFYAEEMDWCYRAREKGWEVYFTPEAEVLHHGGQSGDPLSPAIFVQLHRARYQFYRKHHGAFASFIARMLMAAGALLRAFAWMLIFAFGFIFKHKQAAAARQKFAAFRAAALWLWGMAER